MRLDFGLILLGDLWIWGRLNFGVGVWMNQLIVIPGNIRLLLVFATPLYPKIYGNSIFYRGMMIEQIFYKIRTGLLEQNKLEHMFGL